MVDSELLLDGDLELQPNSALINILFKNYCFTYIIMSSSFL